MCHRQGVTLMELLIYAFLSILVLGSMLAIFLFSKSSYRAGATSYNLSMRAMPLLRDLRRELQETAISSIQTFPERGFAFACARTPEEPETFQISAHGVPRWNSTIAYELVPDPGGRTASLVRHHLPYQDNQPHPRAEWPTSASTGRSVLRGILLDQGTHQVEGPGGLTLRFAYHEKGEDIFRFASPSTGSEGGRALVRLDFLLLEPNSRPERPSFVKFHTLIHPRF